MQVTWNSKTKRITSNAVHKANTPRQWFITLRIATKDAKETLTFRPRQKMTLTELEPFMGEHIDEFERKHGELVEASFIANAR